jgi:hypothetical protein
VPNQVEIQTASLIIYFLHNARRNEQVFVGDCCAVFCTKGDSGNLSDAAVC